MRGRESREEARTRRNEREWRGEGYGKVRSSEKGR